MSRCDTYPYMIRRVYTFARREAKTIVQFILVGGASFIVYISAYTLQSRIMFPGASDNVPARSDTLSKACSCRFTE